MSGLYPIPGSESEQSPEFHAAKLALDRLAAHQVVPDFLSSSWKVARFAKNPQALHALEKLATGLEIPFQKDSQYAENIPQATAAIETLKYCLENASPEIMATLENKGEKFFRNHATFATFLRVNKEYHGGFKPGTAETAPLVLKYSKGFTILYDANQHYNLAAATLASPEGVEAMLVAEQDDDKPTRVVEKFKKSRVAAALTNLKIIAQSQKLPDLNLTHFAQLEPGLIQTMLHEPDEMLFELPPGTSRDDSDDETIWDRRNELSKQPSEFGEEVLKELEGVFDKERRKVLGATGQKLKEHVSNLKFTDLKWVPARFPTKDDAEYFRDRVETFAARTPAPGEEGWRDFLDFFQHLPSETSKPLWKKPDEQLTVIGLETPDYTPLIEPLGRIFRHSLPDPLPDNPTARDLLDYEANETAWDAAWNKHLECILRAPTLVPSFTRPFIEEDQGKNFGLLVQLDPDRVNMLYAVHQKFAKATDIALRGQHPMTILQSDLNAAMKILRTTEKTQPISLSEISLQSEEFLTRAMLLLGKKAEGKWEDATIAEYDAVRTAMMKSIIQKRGKDKDTGTAGDSWMNV